MRLRAKGSVGMADISSMRQGTSRLTASAHHATHPVCFQSIPEGGDGVQDFAGSLEEKVFIELGREEDLLELLHGVTGVLRFDAIVPGEESHSQRRKPG